MDKNQVLESLKFAKENSKKRNFSQSVDLIINLKGLNLKKPEESINTFITLPHETRKICKVVALIGDELQNKAKEVCDFTINKKEFAKYAGDPKSLKKLAKQADFFIAQANLMPDVAKSFGRVLGPIGKMPNPKAGGVVPPTIPNLKPIVEKMKKIIKLETKNEQSVKVIVGKEDMKDEDLAENIMLVYNTVAHLLPDEEQNLRNVIIKLTMGKPFIVGKKPSLEQPFRKVLAEKTGEEKKKEEKKETKKVKFEKKDIGKGKKKKKPQKEKEK
ncbi:MAG: 50S ribosomal protein L1 [Nanoarchaeota archaeon]